MDRLKSVYVKFMYRAIVYKTCTRPVRPLLSTASFECSKSGLPDVQFLCVMFVYVFIPM